MTPTPGMTANVLIVTAVLLTLYDIVAIKLGGHEASISVVLYTQARLHPVIAAALGVLIGHTLWPHFDK